jgi:hypothetical protein
MAVDVEMHRRDDSPNLVASALIADEVLQVQARVKTFVQSGLDGEVWFALGFVDDALETEFIWHCSDILLKRWSSPDLVSTQALEDCVRMEAGMADVDSLRRKASERLAMLQRSQVPATDEDEVMASGPGASQATEALSQTMSSGLGLDSEAWATFGTEVSPERLSDGEECYVWVLIGADDRCLAVDAQNVIAFSDIPLAIRAFLRANQNIGPWQVLEHGADRAKTEFIQRCSKIIADRVAPRLVVGRQILEAWVTAEARTLECTVLNETVSDVESQYRRMISPRTRQKDDHRWKKMDKSVESLRARIDALEMYDESRLTRIESWMSATERRFAIMLSNSNLQEEDESMEHARSSQMSGL